MTATREYRLVPQKLAEAQKLAMRRYLYPQLTICIAVILMSTFLATRGAKLGTIIAFSGVAALIVTYCGFISPRRFRRRLSKCWETYILTIGPDYLLRQQADTPEIRLGFHEVKKVEYLSGRYLRISGRDKYKVLAVPEGIENFNEVLAIVSKLAPVADAKRDRSLKSTVMFGAAFAAYLVMLWAHSKPVVVSLSLIVSCCLIWLFTYMQRSPNVARRSKRFSWLYLLFTLVCIQRLLAIISSKH